MLISAQFSIQFVHYYISKLVRELRLVNLCKFIVVFVAKMLHDLSPNFLTYVASNILKLSFTLNCVLKRANDLKTISNWLVLLSTFFRNLKPFLINENRPRTRQTHNRDIINIIFSVRTVTVTDPRFPPLRFMARALLACAINRRGKNRSVTYGTDLKHG